MTYILESTTATISLLAPLRAVGGSVPALFLRYAWPLRGRFAIRKDTRRILSDPLKHGSHLGTSRTRLHSTLQSTCRALLALISAVVPNLARVLAGGQALHLSETFCRRIEPGRAVLTRRDIICSNSTANLAFWAEHARRFLRFA